MKTLLRFGALWFVLVLLSGGSALGSHLLGGEMQYKFLDANGPQAAPFRYQLTVVVYVNSDSPATPSGLGRPDVEVSIYNKSQGNARIPLTTINSPLASGGLLRIPRTSTVRINPSLPGGCTIPGGNVPVTLAKYTAVVNLPVSFDGYYAFYSDIARNNDVNNIVNPGNTNMSLYTEMAPPLIPNTSPVFSDTAVVVVCQGDTTILINNAFDADGDRLIYTFGTPAAGNPPFPSFVLPPVPVNYLPGYSAVNPFGPGAGNYAALNASTGIARFAATTMGKYVVAIDVKEYRRINGTEVQVGTTRRDVQLVVRPCAPNRSPQFTPATLGQRAFTIEEGQTLNFNLSATDADGNPVSLRVNSGLLDGAGGFNATFAGLPGTIAPGASTGTVTVSGNGSASGQFSFTPRCGEARPNPYDVAVTATDAACGSKTVAEVFQIFVTKTTAPTGLTGTQELCDLSRTYTYTATGPAPTNGYSWRVQGGVIQGASNGSSVQVLWNGSGQGRVSVRNRSTLGCLSDSATSVVNILPAVTLGVTPSSPTICPGQSVTLTASGATSYVWSGGGQTYTGSSITVSPTQTTTYTVTSPNAQCSNGRVTITVNPAVVANAGANRALCSGEQTTLGTAAVTGYTYQWSPAVGLSSTTVAQPVFSQTLAAGLAPQTLTYTVVATSPQGCSAASQVVITLNPAAAADAGPDVTVCANQRVRLGTAALGGYTYQWSPAAGLSSAGAAQPTFTAPTVSTAQTLKLYLTATTAQGCSARDSVLVRINPRPEADAIQGSSSVCPQAGAVAYSIRNPRGTAYQWLIEGGTIGSGQGTGSVTVNWGSTNANASLKAFRLNAEGCSSDTVVFPVRINQLLATERPTGPTRVCQTDGPFTYQTQFTNGSSYAWQIIGGTQVSTNQATLQVQWTRPGTGKIVVTETSQPGSVRCLGTSDTLFVTVLPSPAAAPIAGPRRVCAGAGTVSFSVAGASTSTFQWTVQQGTSAPVALSAAGTTATFAVPAPAAVTAPTSYTLTVRETNALGCTGVASTMQFTVVPQLTAAAVTGPRSVCPGSFAGLGYSLAGAPGSTYQWAITGGAVVSGQGTERVQVDFDPNATARSVSVTETSAVGCAASFSVVLDNATVALNTASVDLQDDRRITLALNVPNNANSPNQVRIMRRDAGSTAAFAQVGTVANTAATYTDTGVNTDDKAYEYRLDLVNACGTTLSSTNHTTMRLELTNAEPGQGRTEGKVALRWSAYLGFPVARYEVYRTADGGQLQLMTTVPATASPTYTAGFASSAAGFNQGFRIKAISAEAQASQAWSNQADAAFENKLGFYNVITPNGDGLNDVFFIRSVELYPGNSFAVFNRWGKEVYRTSNYRNTWGADGQPAGTYYFEFKQSNGQISKGWFEVVR
ncbi:gliding motility-associated C-terminal domain-containing protein [Hymenobacter latericus]|uniref:gliding motility-associated C-terminal domain-containing protein n=1 Tax=Hymenobacter sp. YIM 151858-1 TaxID=2987688 RepID=UPI002225F492|nr:gliding motility-associated C-terminal domain-containing protein [Hymenobacter sp. YIM 151858-1]UYZ59650.1 gliding motility-associated C-terminal domain-containing protein [Hymenobacter sp. YIM 151858-1]